jgi:hypothetical protein
MLNVVTDAQAHDELRLDLDQLVREGARRMLAAGLEPRSTRIWPRTRPSGTRVAGGWWCAMATSASVRW